MMNPRADELDDYLKLIKQYEYLVSKHITAGRLLDQIQLQQTNFQ